MLKLEEYGVHANQFELMEKFFTQPMKDLAGILKTSIAENGGQATFEKYSSEPLFKEAIGYIAFEGDLESFNKIVYQAKKNEMTLHFDWEIPGQKTPLTFSNHYFSIFFNDLYKHHLNGKKENILTRGAILAGLAKFSSCPWKTFLLPVTSKMIADLNALPFLDSSGPRNVPKNK